MMRELAGHMLFSFISSVSFGALCNVPKRSIVAGGIIGIIGWIAYIELTAHGYGVFMSSLACSLLLSFAGQLAASTYKMPVTVYFVPGLVPVVPGITFYEAFRSLVLGQYTASGVVFLHVGYGAVGLACGIAAADALYRLTIGTVMRRCRNG
ncbi:threonine/serine exporter family protein [Paenibacillus thiaminolyticus]|uniref:Threonine/serine exporter family protein n=2 Tax=Paenibacillus thiaminolyticus TaxID=49283 RepID=A0ABT4FSD9_PANTH|nr:threonine/serine exporter family protein [Paenibacillus thiaminolyticus]MCY9533831.1 threonine/serine exporter family protein [Paenibacillus thiaminolyticus]MCY9601794.1 threonine/serine exporter family protein [Paenibacillus thiaminolyticus]MCY9607074.1 threonine/serine exporter family protein [Paenibacillus thiaminolyticus]MCY9614238.1 threonine/serine exporter family protein [Paenibacillus thiaminolyticus]MCY9619205.1 threonine/serine exporter family protein [Paenibacillus thiaminolyticu